MFTSSITCKRGKEWIDLAKQVYEAREYRKRYEELEKKLMDELVVLSEGKESYGGNFKLEEIERKGSIAYDKIPVLKELDLESYRKEGTSYWKLSISLTKAIDEMGIL